MPIRFSSQPPSKAFQRAATAPTSRCWPAIKAGFQPPTHTRSIHVNRLERERVREKYGYPLLRTCQHSVAIWWRQGATARGQTPGEELVVVFKAHLMALLVVALARLPVSSAAGCLVTLLSTLPSSHNGGLVATLVMSPWSPPHCTRQHEPPCRARWPLMSQRRRHLHCEPSLGSVHIDAHTDHGACVLDVLGLSPPQPARGVSSRSLLHHRRTRSLALERGRQIWLWGDRIRCPHAGEAIAAL